MVGAARSTSLMGPMASALAVESRIGSGKAQDTSIDGHQSPDCLDLGERWKDCISRCSVGDTQGASRRPTSTIRLSITLLPSAYPQVHMLRNLRAVLPYLKLMNTK